jgi:hypothetical protein
MPVVAVNPRRKSNHIVWGFVRKPELLYRLIGSCRSLGLSPLAVEDFEYTDHQLLFGVVSQAVRQDEKEHQNFIMGECPKKWKGFLEELLAQTEKLDTLDDKLLEELLSRFLDLRRAHAMINVNQLRFLQEDDQQQGGANLKVYQEQTIQFTRLLHSLDQAKRKIVKR